jgi:hypothetical protein
MKYVINIALNGRFYFEVSRMSYEVTVDIKTFVDELRVYFPTREGYDITVGICSPEAIKRTGI